MDSTEQTAQPEKPKQRVRRAVSPEVAALVREEDEALGATIAVAKAVAEAAMGEANAAIAGAHAKRNGVLRSVLRQLELHEADFIGWDGYGPDTVLILDVPIPTEDE